MSVNEFVSDANYTDYLSWATNDAFNRTYEEWQPSENYTTLTIILHYEDDSVADSRIYGVTGDLASFYSLLENETEYTSTLVSSATEAWQSESTEAPTPERLQKRACGTFCGINIHCLWPVCPKCRTYNVGNWRKRCMTH